MADIHQMREALKNVYFSEKWSDKVNKMSEEQVTAIYIRFQAEKKL